MKLLSTWNTKLTTKLHRQAKVTCAPAEDPAEDPFSGDTANK